jgi:hypothetical protein
LDRLLEPLARLQLRRIRGAKYEKLQPPHRRHIVLSVYNIVSPHTICTIHVLQEAQRLETNLLSRGHIRGDIRAHLRQV